MRSRFGGAAGKEQLERSDFCREAFTWSPFIAQEPWLLGHLLLNVGTVQEARIGFGGFALQGFSFPCGFWVFIEERTGLGMLGSVAVELQVSET